MPTHRIERDALDVASVSGTNSGWERLKELVDAHEASAARHQAFVDRIAAALVDQVGTTVKPQKQEILDIDDTFCAAHGGQQLAFWNAHHDERGFGSMHIYHVASGTPVVTILRPGRTPKGTEVRTVSPSHINSPQPGPASFKKTQAIGSPPKARGVGCSLAPISARRSGKSKRIFPYRF